MKKVASIHTIAKELGVSATTISFVINGKARQNRISEDVIDKVSKHLTKINYRPNVFAQSLRTGKSHVIGMLVEDISDPFFSEIARGVEIGLENKAYKILFMSTKNRKHNAEAAINLLRGQSVDGFIIAPSPGLEKEIGKLIDSGKPVVLFDRYFPSLDSCNIVVDNEAGGYMGTMELLHNGFGNPAFVTLDSDQVQMVDRKKGYMRAMNTVGKSSGSILEVPYNLNVEETAMLIEAFLNASSQIDAVLFATNYLVIAGLQAFKNLCKVVGLHMGIVGFDDNKHFAFFSPSITAIAQPAADIAQNIVTYLLEALEGQKTCPLGNVLLPVQLIRRESSRLIPDMLRLDNKGFNCVDAKPIY